MMISSELLNLELTSLRERYQKTINDLNALNGALQFCEHLIQTASEPLPEILQPKEEGGEQSPSSASI